MTQLKADLIKLIKNLGSISGNVINVEKFLNHRINSQIMHRISDMFIKRFPPETFDTVLTVESSGIPLAVFISAKISKDLVFIKKKRPLTMEEYFCVESFSYTKREKTLLFLSKKVTVAGERFLFVDDFFAKGDTFNAVNQLVDEAKGIISGFGVIIDKSNCSDIFSILTLKEIINNEC